MRNIINKLFKMSTLNTFFYFHQHLTPPKPELIWTWTCSGRGGSPGSSEEDAAARERPGPDPGEADGRKPEAGGEGKSPPKRESLQTKLICSFFFLFFIYLSISVLSRLHPIIGHCDDGRDLVAGGVWTTTQAKEEVEALEKKMQQLENELAQTQSNLEQATHNLEEKEKALQNVSHFEAFCHETKKAWNGF